MRNTSVHTRENERTNERTDKQTNERTDKRTNSTWKAKFVATFVCTISGEIVTKERNRVYFRSLYQGIACWFIHDGETKDR